MVELRLTSLLKKEAKRLGNMFRVWTAITIANKGAVDAGSIHIRTLARIRDHPDKVKLTLSNFIALDNYFKLRGEGLRDKPLFLQRGVLEHMAEQRGETSEQLPVTFLVGSKPRTRERRTDLIFWDTRSVAALAAPLSRLGVTYELEDVLLRPVSDHQDLHKESWSRLINREDRNLIAIGSPRACLATELILAKLFDVKAFGLTKNKSLKAPLPFEFAWPSKLMRGLRSSFALTPDEIAARSSKLAPLLQRGTHGIFFVGKKEFPVPLSADSGDTYGVIAAQRRSTGRVLMVVCGFTGPATYAAATCVARMNAELPHTPGENSKVLWMPIQARFKTDPGMPGDSRWVENISRLAPPQIWPPG